MNVDSGTYIFFTTYLAGGTSGLAMRLDIYHAQRERIQHVRYYDIGGMFEFGKAWWYSLKEKSVRTATQEHARYNAIEFTLGHDPIDEKKMIWNIFRRGRCFV